MDGDLVIVVSSDLISKVMGQYFNNEMFKCEVEIVDLQPSAEGYAFSLNVVLSDREKALSSGYINTSSYYGGVDNSFVPVEKEVVSKPKKRVSRRKKSEIVYPTCYEVETTKGDGL